MQLSLYWPVYADILLPLVQDKLPEEIKQKVKWSVGRDSAEDKVRDYLEWMKAVKREVIHVVSWWGQIGNSAVGTVKAVLEPAVEASLIH